MFSIQLKCPQCCRESAFAIHAPTEYVARKPVAPGDVTRHGTVSSRIVCENELVQAYGTAACGMCNQPVLVWFECRRGELEVQREASRSDYWRYCGVAPKILATYPEPAKPDDSPNYPHALRQVFIELQEDVRAKRSPARIIAGCRSVMEVALRELNYEKGNLVDRIDKARSDGVVTEGLRGWAHRVRLQGNEAIHELTAEFHEAEELVDFIRLFLEVAFDLPARLRSRTEATK